MADPGSDLWNIRRLTKAESKSRQELEALGERKPPPLQPL